MLNSLVGGSPGIHRASPSVIGRQAKSWFSGSGVLDSLVRGSPGTHRASPSIVGRQAKSWFSGFGVLDSLVGGIANFTLCDETDYFVVSLPIFVLVAIKSHVSIAVGGLKYLVTLLSLVCPFTNCLD